MHPGLLGLQYFSYMNPRKFSCNNFRKICLFRKIANCSGSFAASLVFPLIPLHSVLSVITDQHVVQNI